jgi:hypothetical protein
MGGFNAKGEIAQDPEIGVRVNFPLLPLTRHGRVARQREPATHCARLPYD